MNYDINTKRVLSFLLVTAMVLSTGVIADSVGDGFPIVESEVDLSIFDQDITLSDGSPSEGDSVTITAVLHGDQSTGSGTWEKSGVVVDIGGTGEEKFVFAPAVQKLSNGTYVMFYSGGPPGATYGGYRIFRAISSDGIAWQKQGMVMDYGGAYETYGAYCSNVLIDGSGTYHMWYTGLGYSGGYRAYILKATSYDEGFTWQKQGLDLNYGSSADPDGVNGPSVLFDGTQWHMWYGGIDWGSPNEVRICHAHKASLPDPWIKDGVVLNNDGPYDYPSASYPNVISTGAGYEMFYTGYIPYTGPHRVLHATSPDGLSWTRTGIAIEGTLPLEGNQVGFASVALEGITYKAWYSGYDGTNWRIFYADKPPVEPGLDATCTVSFYLDSIAEGNLIDRQFNVFVPGDGQTTVSADWTAEAGDHDIIVEVSEVNPTDSDLSNNIASTQISVEVEAFVDLSIYDEDITLSDGNPTEGETVTIDAVVNGDKTIWGNSSQTTLLFSDDFDDGTLNKWVLSYWNPRGLLEVTNSEYHSPPYSMHAQSYPYINTGPWVAKFFNNEYDNIKGETWFYLPEKIQEYEYLDILRLASTIPGWNGGIIKQDYVLTLRLEDDDYSIDIIEVTFPNGNPQKSIRAWDILELTPLSWHKISNEIKGDQFTISVDDVVIFQETRLDTIPIDFLFLGDPGGISGGGGDAYWDNVKVWEISETQTIIHDGLDATCTVSFYLDSIAEGNLIDRQFNVFVPGDGQTTVTTDWTAVAGDHTIIVEVSDVNPPDSDLSNNVASKAIFVDNPATATATGPQGAHHDRFIVITYEWTGSPSAVYLYYSTNAGDNWNYLGIDHSVDGRYKWPPGANPGPKPSKFYWIANAKDGADDVGIPANGTPPEAGPFNWKTWDVCTNSPRPLSGGSSNWFFISVPLEISGDLSTVFDDANWGDGGTTWDYIQWYDANDPSDPWKSYSIYRPQILNDDTIVDNTMGFWIHLTSNDGDGVLTVGEGTEISSTIIQLNAGWNLVGYPTLNEATIVADALWGTGADIIEAFDPTAPYKLKAVGPTYIMMPGEAYWIHVPADTTWTIDW